LSALKALIDDKSGVWRRRERVMAPMMSGRSGRYQLGRMRGVGAARKYAGPAHSEIAWLK